MPDRPTITLRNVTESDLSIFFANQQDAEALHMAAFVPKNPSDRAAFEAHWAKLLADDHMLTKTILAGKTVAGYVGSFDLYGKREVTYWIGREFWGQGIATHALAALLAIEETRPLYARAAQDNVGSLRVLQKCGFAIVGTDRGFANARGEEIDEYVLMLDR
jgi:RimJ/RimL family protein N-acetyltransferase